MESKDPFAILCDKLQAPHPLLQRIAVSSIFQRFAAAPSPDAAAAMMQSGSGKEAIARCLSSANPCIVDQSVRELCSIAKSGKISLGQAAVTLQASIDSIQAASISSLQVLVSGIGFLCRLHVAKQDKTITVNPLLKALQSREESSTAVLQQVRLLLLHSGNQQQEIQFLQPFLFHVFLDPCRARSNFARQLHSNLCAIAAARPSLGPPVLKMLIGYAQSRFLEFPQDIDILCEEIQELVDLVEESSDSVETADFGIPMLELLFDLWHDSKQRRLPSLPFVALVQRLSLLNCVSDKHQCLDVYLASLAYFLAIAELEQEQLLILALAQSWLRKETSSKFSLQSILLWIFPTLHIFTSPSGLVKQSASSLLSRIDSLLNDANQPSYRSIKSDSRQLGAMAYELIHSLWAADAAYVEKWFRNLSANLSDPEFPMLLSIVTTALTFHQSPKVSRLAVDTLASLGRHHAVWGVSLFPVFLFSIKYHQRRDINSNALIVFLSALPDICAHPTTLPMSMQLLQHMVDYKDNLRIQATSIRLICKIWQRTDRAQPLLQRTLRPSWFSEAEFETDVLTSRAVSLKDVCSHDPDAGIELIQSVQACIESRSSILKSIGLQSLALLCGDDAIDFYTAWKVISKFVSPLPENVSVCRSLCMFLKHGAADAAANPEDAKMILNMLWEFSLFGKDASSFSGVRAAAVESLCAYEVELLNETMLDEDKHVDILLRGSGTEAKLQCEKLVFKFLEYEHTNRQRAVTEKTNATKLEKLLDSIPRSFSKSDCPGFLLFFRNATKGNLTGKKSALKAEEAASKRVFLEVVKSLNVFGDLILALLSLVSWSCFMPQWLKHGHDNTELACQKIAKVCMDASDDAIPRISENSTLALAALSKLCPQPSSTSSSLMKHFKTKISLVEHQSAIWSAAIALGVLTTSMHPTDWDAKAQAVRLLIKAASDHNSGFVVGSAAVGLGFACQSLLSSEFSSINSSKDMEILSEILLCVLKQLSHRCPESSSAILELGQDSLLATESITGNDNDRIFKEDNFWASVGLVFALGRLATALGRSGQSDLVKRIGEAVFSWIPDSVGDAEAMSLATGSSLVLPELLQELDRLEALDSGEIDRLLNRLHDLIRKIIDLPESRRNSKPWLVHVFKAGCVGYGGVVAKVLQSGAHPLGIETVTDLLETLCRGYTEIETPQYCLGAMLGLVNALGAGLTSESDLGAIGSGSSLQIQIGDKVTTPLMISSANEESIRTMVQHIVRISHSSDDQRVRDYAKWCLGLMHSTWLRIDQARSSAKDGEDSARTTVRWSYQPVSLSSLAKNNTVRLLCEFLSGVGLTKISVPCSEIITVMRCLEQAPRLPMLDWLGLIRRMMQHPEWFTEQLSGFDHGEVRKQCFILSIRQADRVPPLASVLDEFCEASKLVRVEPKLQLVVLGNLGVLRKVFSQARMEKVLVDVIQVLRQIQSSGDQDHARDCRIEIWRGLAKFWDQTDTKDLEQIEGCIREMSYISPGRFSTRSSAEAIEQDRVEWSTAVDCLKHARTSWLLDVIKVTQGDYFEKFAFVRCRLAAIKVLPISSLKPIRSQLINQRLTGQWILLTECAIALKSSEFEEKMDWLLDTIDAAYLSKFPSTAISFLGLLASCWSSDSYLFPLDQPAVVRQLPRSLRSLCLHTKGNQSARGFATKVFAVLERVVEPELASFEETEDELRELSRVLQRVAMSMKEYASHQMLLKLAELSQWE